MSHTFKVNTSSCSLNAHIEILEVLSNVTVAHGGKFSLTISLIIALFKKRKITERGLNRELHHD